MSKYIKNQSIQYNRFGFQLDEYETIGEYENLISITTILLLICIFTEGLLLMICGNLYLTLFLKLELVFSMLIIVMGISCYWILLSFMHYLLEIYLEKKYLLMSRFAHLLFSFFSCIYMKIYLSKLSIPFY